MIVTRNWLEKFIDLDGISNDELAKTFNRIGLEVDSVKEHKIPQGVVVGKIVACGKHPDADKLSLCQIDIGDGEPKQIVCGAANVVDAEYVAVATIGTIMPEGFEIKEAKLRGVDSYGMVCSSEELGLPKTNDGIMILDDSIGDLEIGRELGSYPKVADTVIELELTANRGDCLSIHGVARDLSAALDRPLKKIDSYNPQSNNIGIARKISIHSQTDDHVDLVYTLAQRGELKDRLAILLRLGFVDIEPKGMLENIIQYTSHSTGVILHAYDTAKLKDQDGKIDLDIRQKSSGQIAVAHGNKALSIVGIAVNSEYVATDESEEILFEASYIEPEKIVEAVALNKLKTDPFYYNTSRGSEPDLDLGGKYLQNICTCAGGCKFYDGEVSLRSNRKTKSLNLHVGEINAIIGNSISKTEIFNILNRLGMKVATGSGDAFGVHIPLHRHDIVNLHDVTEEITRMIGIDNIEARPLEVIEQDRLTDATMLFKAKRDLRQRAVSAGFYEAVTYAFADKSKLRGYGFDTVKDELDLANPIVDELDTLRSTLLVNLLDAVKRNVSYGIRKIPLFEIGAVFDSDRNQTDKIAFVWSGQSQTETVANQGKPKDIEFATFVDSVSRVVGEMELIPCSEENGLIHPYQSADIVIDGKKAGFVSKLHPQAAKDYGVGDTYIAQIDLESVLPKHIYAHPVSNYQGTYKDISVLVDKDVPYQTLSNAIDELDLPLLKKHYVIDVYEDESLGNEKSVTIRLFLQSSEETLSDTEIEDSVGQVLKVLEDRCQAKLR